MDDTKPVVSSEFGESNETPTTKRAVARAESPATTKPGDSTWPARPAKAKVPPWLIGVYVLAGAVALVLLFQIPGWIGTARQTRIQRAVDSVTPERLLARCGPPTEDVTKDVFPILMRTISYSRGGKGGVVVAFSRTAEEKSDWVFLSMKDVSGPMTYTTPEAQIAALSCLDSRK